MVSKRELKGELERLKVLRRQYAPTVSETSSSYVHPTIFVTFWNLQSDKHAAGGQVGGGEKGRFKLLSSSIFSFELLSALFMCATEYNTMNAF